MNLSLDLRTCLEKYLLQLERYSIDPELKTIEGKGADKLYGQNSSITISSDPKVVSITSKRNQRLVSDTRQGLRKGLFTFHLMCYR